jgi:hypothetical protein
MMVACVGGEADFEEEPRHDSSASFHVHVAT